MLILLNKLSIVNAAAIQNPTPATLKTPLPKPAPLMETHIPKKIVNITDKNIEINQFLGSLKILGIANGNSQIKM